MKVAQGGQGEVKWTSFDSLAVWLELLTRLANVHLLRGGAYRSGAERLPGRPRAGERGHGHRRGRRRRAGRWKFVGVEATEGIRKKYVGRLRRRSFLARPAAWRPQHPHNLGVKTLPRHSPRCVLGLTVTLAFPRTPSAVAEILASPTFLPTTHPFTTVATLVSLLSQWTVSELGTT